MLKHIGKHNEKKVVVLYHQVPAEDHMCLIVYSDLLPRLTHDAIMSSIESAPGQQAANLADALFRTTMGDGRNVLEVLHKEGFMKKVQTSQVIMTPTPASKIRLDELNTILAEMGKGADAVKRLAEMDSQSGLQTKKRDNTGRTVGEPVKAAAKVAEPAFQAGPNDALTDEAIASQQLAQATRMRNEAKSMLAEATRLEQDAASLVPPTVVKATRAAKAKAPVTPTKTSTKVTNDKSASTKKAAKNKV